MYLLTCCRKHHRDLDDDDDDAPTLPALELHVSKKVRTLEQMQIEAHDMAHPKTLAKGDGSSTSEPIQYKPSEPSAATRPHKIHEVAPPKRYKTQSQPAVQLSHPLGDMLVSPPQTPNVTFESRNT